MRLPLFILLINVLGVLASDLDSPAAHAGRGLQHVRHGSARRREIAQLAERAAKKKTTSTRKPTSTKNANKAKATTTKRATTTSVKKAATSTKKATATTKPVSNAKPSSTAAAQPAKTASPAVTKGAVGGNKSWTLLQQYSGASFFSKWDFFTAPDPTHGFVKYVDANTAVAKKLVSVKSNGAAVIRADTSTPAPSTGRESVRITSKLVFSGGLVLLDAVHIPTGCGTWPAFWSFGPNWPGSGEIDIVEGVSDYTVNQASIHTSSGCRLPTNNMSSLGVQGPYLVGSTDCNPYTTSGSGCGIRDVETKGYGPGFNKNGGGVYAMVWVSDGIQVWFFPRQSIPSDIQLGRPNPSKWSLSHLKAYWPSSTCNTNQFFKTHQLVFDTTFCGDWAGNVWNSGGVTGQEQSCAARTGYRTCESYVQAQGGSFSNAYWEINYVKFYQDVTDPSMSRSY